MKQILRGLVLMNNRRRQIGAVAESALPWLSKWYAPRLVQVEGFYGCFSCYHSAYESLKGSHRAEMSHRVSESQNRQVQVTC